MKKKLLVAATAGAMTMAAGSAFALENEFHGMFRNYMYLSNAYSGGGGFNMAKDAGTSRYTEQRARLQYIAKANDDLRLVTHFELDSRWGGNDYTGNAAKYSGTSDAGNLDADGISLETKNVYLDFKIPSTPVRATLGVQPFNDAYQGNFGNFDGAGAMVVAKVDAITGTAAWFRATDATVKYGTDFKTSADIYILDGKFAVNKDMSVGANYYVVDRDTGTSATVAEFTHMLGANFAGTFGPAAVTAAFGYQFGDFNDAQNRDLSAYGGNVTAKIKAGPGKVNLAGIYLSGQDEDTTGDYNGWQTASAAVTYFNASNMWLLIRNGATINTSTSPSEADLANKGLGLVGLFAGYEGTADKIFYSANIGWAQTAETRKTATTDPSKDLGTELNCTVGYKLYDNLAVSGTFAYLIAGDGLAGKTADLLPGLRGAANADDPYMANIRVDYSF